MWNKVYSFCTKEVVQKMQLDNYVITSQKARLSNDDDTLCIVCEMVAQVLESVLDEDSTEVILTF